jgi:mannosyltransferase
MAQIALPRPDVGRLAPRSLQLTPALALTGILVLGTAVRFAALAHQSVWLDEAFSVFVSRKSPGEIISFVSTNDSHPPLYYLMLHYWINAFGESEVALRSLSGVFGVGAIYVGYKLGQELYGEETGLTVGLLVAVSPLLVWYSQEARMYSVLFLLTAAAAYCLVRAIKDVRSWWWAGYALAGAAALYTDNGGIWFFIASNLVLLPAVIKQPSLRLPWLVAQVAVVLLYLPWLPSFIAQSRNVTQSFWLSPPTFSDVLNTFVAFNSYNFPLEALGIVYLTAVLVWVHFIPEKYAPRRSLPSAWLFLPVIISFALSLRQPIFLLRNLIAASLGYYVLAGRAAWSFDNRRFAMAIIAPLLLMNVASLVYDHTTERKEQWRDAAAYVDSKAAKGQMILFDAGYTEMPFRYYDRSGLPGRGYPFDEALVHQQALGSEDLAKTTQGFPGVWLVLSHNTDVDASGAAKSWLDAHYKLKEQRSYQDIQVLFYETAASQNGSR